MRVPGAALPDGADAIGEVLCSAIAQVVAVDAGDHDIAQVQGTDGHRQSLRFGGVHRQRTTVGDVAERATAGADIAEDHEGGGAAAEALADVGATRLLADRVQAVLPQRAAHRIEALAAGGRRTDPVRLGQRGVGGDDADRIARGLARRALLLAGDQAHASAPEAGRRARRLAVSAAHTRSAQAGTASPQPRSAVRVTAQTGLPAGVDAFKAVQFAVDVQRQSVVTAAAAHAQPE
jgi:hypothetical protein